MHGSVNGASLYRKYRSAASLTLHLPPPLLPALRIHVVYGAADELIPARGRVWLKGVLEGVGLIDAEGGGVEDAEGDAEGASDAPILGTGVWTEVPEAGHDDVLFLEEVVDPIFGRVV
ncbi:hypothetical protein C8R44DRAFT_885405 [Mycena epipterygia]|nr:hypothetical protein C8R44DRAFT_885405 [Mycena epipterygia]